MCILGQNLRRGIWSGEVFWLRRGLRSNVCKSSSVRPRYEVSTVLFREPHCIIPGWPQIQLAPASWQPYSLARVGPFGEVLGLRSSAWDRPRTASRTSTEGFTSQRQPTQPVRTRLISLAPSATPHMGLSSTKRDHRLRAIAP